jgi:hypothetical protein
MFGGAIAFWIRGYRKADYFPSDTTVKFLTKPVLLPRWLYLVCGAPKSQKYPEGVITAWALAAQLSGIGLVLHWLATVLLKQDTAGMLLNFIVIFSLIYGSIYWLTEKNAYKRS